MPVINRKGQWSIRAAAASVLFVLCAFHTARGADRATTEDFTVRQKRFIDRLYSEKEHFSCAAETRRLLEYSPRVDRRADYLYFIQLNYFLGRQYRSVVAHYREERQPAFRMSLLASAGHRFLGDTRSALKTLEEVEPGLINVQERRELDIRKIDLMVYSADYPAALKSAEHYFPAGSRDHAAKALCKDLERYREIHLKSVAFSMALSAVVPGTGQAYAGRYRDGLISFLAVAALALGSYQSFSSGKEELGYPLLFVCALTYGGTIYGAYNAAARSNITARGDFYRAFRQKHIPPYDPEKYLDRGALLK